ncbi:aminopeptidase [Candidatus Uhrbacteria bacterium]|nr:aminopeptidase [Candidatus Uhrbacteria bacterium]
MRCRPIAFFSVVLACLMQAGCYVINLAKGQAHISRSAIGLEEARQLPGLTERQRVNLDLVGEIKGFAESRLGLEANDSYSAYYPNPGDRPVMWILTAARRDRLEPHVWRYPIVGKVNFRSFFSESQARYWKERMERRGYDVHLRPVEAYSTGGWFDDPILPDMLDWDEGRLAATVVHELGHGTVVSRDDSAFNESFAEFVGETGAEMFLSEKYGPDSPVLRRFRERNADRRLFDGFVRQSAEMAKRAYARTDRPLKERRSRLGAGILRLYDSFRPRFAAAGYRNLKLRGLNNAWLISNLNYATTEPFERAFLAVGGDWRRFIALCSEAARDDEPFVRLGQVVNSFR